MPAAGAGCDVLRRLDWLCRDGAAGKNTDAARERVRRLAQRLMRSLLQKNLFVVGELLDVTGLLGGYNLHWAWASGMAAARELTRSTTAQAVAPAKD